MITYWPARSMLTHFRRNSRRASPVNLMAEESDESKEAEEVIVGIGVVGLEGIVWQNIVGHGKYTVIPRYNAPRYNADLAITRFFIPKVFLPHLLRKGKFSAKLVDISL